MTRTERIKIRNERIKARNKEQQRQKEEVEKLQETLEKSKKELELKDKLTIEICIHCFRYQKRLTWMLSSLLQQKGNIPNIIVNISHTDEDGSPTTEEVCDFFRKKGLNIKETKMTKDNVHNRAVARNIQARETTSDYILFADSDMVYDINFFEDLQKQLKTNLKDVNVVMGADRISLNDQFCIKYFEEDTRKYPCEIEDVANICSKFPVKWVTGKHVAPGNFQLASVISLRERGGKYSGRQRDWWRNTKSDRQFRLIMGGRKPINVKKQFHLNHDRGGPDIQR